MAVSESCACESVELMGVCGSSAAGEVPFESDLEVLARGYDPASALSGELLDEAWSFVFVASDNDRPAS